MMIFSSTQTTRFEMNLALRVQSFKYFEMYDSYFKKHQEIIIQSYLPL